MEGPMNTAETYGDFWLHKNYISNMRGIDYKNTPVHLHAMSSDL